MPTEVSTPLPVTGTMGKVPAVTMLLEVLRAEAAVADDEWAWNLSSMTAAAAIGHLEEGDDASVVVRTSVTSLVDEHMGFEVQVASGS